MTRGFAPPDEPMDGPQNGEGVRSPAYGVASRWRASEAAQTATFVLMDIAVVWGSTILAYFVRFEGDIPADLVGIVTPVAFAASLLFPLLFLVFGLYGFIWRYVGVPTLVRLGYVTALGIAIMLAADFALATPPVGRPVPLGTLVIFGVLIFTGFFGVRIFGRLIAYVQSGQATRRGSRVLIVGAGDAGSLLQRDIENNPSLGVRVVGFVDDDPAKRGKYLGRARVLGAIGQVEQVVHDTQADEIFVAMPSASVEDMRHALYACGRARLPVRIVPALAVRKGELGLYDLEDVDLEDFLGREPVVTDLRAVRASLEGKRVLVTGAAGSIGSELCRQIVNHNPAKLVMVEIDESRLYEVYLEVKDVAPSAAWMALCDIRDEEKLARVFEYARPDAVIHAAAYKHVPLMELEPDEAVLTNVLGTRNVIAQCCSHGVCDLTLISTDKAVMPTSVMGATKRAAEKMFFAAARQGIRCTVVRFGNVLGSRGSVVPIFEQALRRGERIRITDPEVTRYFMTISEAVQLVLQARVLTEGADLFVLDMGDPVRVLDLAQALIEMRGGRAEVEFSGLRPAEKMHEVLIASDEGLVPTSCEKVMRASAVPVVSREFGQLCEEVAASVRKADAAAVRAMVARLVPEYSGGMGA